MLAGHTRPAESLPTAAELDFRQLTAQELAGLAGLPSNYLLVGSKARNGKGFSVRTFDASSSSSANHNANLEQS